MSIFLQIPILFITFVPSYHSMAGIEMLALISGSAYHNKKDVCLTFSSVQLKRRKFQKGKQMETTVGVYPSCIYTWHRCAPSYGGVRFVLSYIYLLGVGIYCILSLFPRFFLRPQLTKMMKQYDSCAISLYMW